VHTLFGERNFRIGLGVRVSPEDLGGVVLRRKAVTGGEQETDPSDNVSIAISHSNLLERDGLHSGKPALDVTVRAV
jgi:hypothetical protein